MSERVNDLVRFYELLDKLEKAIGGARTLSCCSGRDTWPQRGVYFFREPGENRTHSGNGPRIVRVGTHAVKPGAATSIWTRLSQHKGQAGSGGGNHRGSIFRLLIGMALIDENGCTCRSWGKGSSGTRELRTAEHPLEVAVSRVIRKMPFLWLAVADPPGPDSLRGYIERNSLALLSNHAKPCVDPPSSCWLGRHCDTNLVRSAGLWNSRHVKQRYEPSFLDTLERLVTDVESSRC